MKTLKQIMSESPVPRRTQDNTMGDLRSQQIFLNDNFKSSKKITTYEEKTIYYVLSTDKKHTFFALKCKEQSEGIIAYAEFNDNSESKKIPGLVVSYYWKSPSAPKGIISFIFSMIIKNYGGILSDYSQTVEANNLWKKFVTNPKNNKFHFYLIQLITTTEFRANEVNISDSKSVISSIDSVFKDGSKFYDYRLYVSNKKL